MLRYHEIAQNERKVLALTGLTPTEFADLVPVFTTSFHAYLQDQTLEGYERIGRAYVPYRNSALPTMEDKLLFILVYLKQAPTQEVQGSLFGITQSKANTWIHVLHAVLNRALATHGDLPERTFIIEEAQAATDQAETSLADGGNGRAGATDRQQDSPFLSRMGQNAR
jgi:hypothetical protein